MCALAGAVERAAGLANGAVEATRDPGSGAYNASFLNAFLTHALAQARRRSESLSVLCVGTDRRLAQIRSQDGSEIADAALKRMARAMTSTLRTTDVVARLDDGRLVAVLPGASVTDAVSVAEAVRRAIAEAGVTAAAANPIAAPIGVAAFPEHARDVGPLVAAAGEALARAEVLGPDRVAVAPRPVRNGAPSITRYVG
jgi:diguanylate cyclase (GGDEF)-like protein